MSWGTNKASNIQPVLRLAAGLALLSLPAVAAAQVMVVKASGAAARSYKAGTRLPETARIALGAGDSVTLLDKKGTRTLKGPGTFTPASPPQAATRSTIGAIAGAGARRARVGAVRGVNQGARELWQIDSVKGGTMCVTDPARTSLWRPDDDQAAKVTLADAAGRVREELEWPAARYTLAWPANMPAADGARYRISWPGAERPTEVTLRMIDASAINDNERLAAELIGKGCEDQLDILIETNRQPAGVTVASQD